MIPEHREKDPFADLASSSDAPAAAAPASSPIVPAHVRSAALEDAPTSPAAGPGGAAPASSSASPIEQFDYDAEARDLIEFAYACFSPIYPSIDPIYTPDARSRIAAAAAPLMRKYGVNLGALGPELAFLVTVTPFIVPTYQAIQHDKQNAAAAAATSSSSSSTTITARELGGAAAANDDHAGGNPDSPLKHFPGQT